VVFEGRPLMVTQDWREGRGAVEGGAEPGIGRQGGRGLNGMLGREGRPFSSVSCPSSFSASPWGMSKVGREGTVGNASSRGCFGSG
jgi:hypothetical protein